MYRIDSSCWHFYLVLRSQPFTPQVDRPHRPHART